MKNSILNYRKTKHFIFRQWDRAINDDLLYRVLPLLKETRINKSTLFWIDLTKMKQAPKCKHQKLGLVVKNNLLISCFWASNEVNSEKFAQIAKTN